MLSYDDIVAHNP